jgi:hypothetical protein|tara:strand:+ start:42974 stop:43390 length:417 start_codon:yes stop_codon:yes gene_type:complete
MGRRNLEKLLLDTIINEGYESVSLVACNERTELVYMLEGIGIDVDVVDYDPKFPNPRDVIYDNVKFNELVVDFNAEKHYPIGNVYKGDMIVIGDNDQHNGDCNPIDNVDVLIEQNNITNVDFSYNIDKWFVVKGNNAD